MSDLQCWLSVYWWNSFGADHFLMQMCGLGCLGICCFSELCYFSLTCYHRWNLVHPNLEAASPTCLAFIQPWLHPGFLAVYSLNLDKNWLCLHFDYHSFLCFVTGKILSLWSNYLFMVFPIMCECHSSLLKHSIPLHSSSYSHTVLIFLPALSTEYTIWPFHQLLSLHNCSLAVSFVCVVVSQLSVAGFLFVSE